MPTSGKGTKIAVVTGGTGALGAAVARAFERASYEVHVTASRGSDAAGWAGPGRAHAVDLARLGPVRSLAAELEEVHAVALCAGAFAPASLASLTEDDLDNMLNANLKTASYTLAAFASHIAPGGAAVVVGSQAYGGAAGKAPYAASKAAALSFARSAARELAPRGVRVNAVLPDVIDTPANRRAMPDADFSRFVTPDEVAAVILWLCSPEARVVNGNFLEVGR